MRRPPISTRTATLFPYTALFRSGLGIVAANAGEAEWDRLRTMAKASKSAVERSTFYTLLGSAKDEALAERALALALTDEPGETVSAAIIGAVAANHAEMAVGFRSEERRGGKEWVSTWRSRESPEH